MITSKHYGMDVPGLLGTVGISPVDETLIGLASEMKAADCAKWLKKLHALGYAC
jgi:hypothetical protein